mmetsp:Transcript_43646/g.113764  ORF Transcript_43646/g.113764 Transcript_43646/m.113764 type:complete len:102 (-) Transcript_43646:1359-1664(-)
MGAGRCIFTSCMYVCEKEHVHARTYTKAGIMLAGRRVGTQWEKKKTVYVKGEHTALNGVNNAALPLEVPLVFYRVGRFGEIARASVDHKRGEEDIWCFSHH